MEVSTQQYQESHGGRIDTDHAEDEIEKLKEKGELYQPSKDYFHSSDGLHIELNLYRFDVPVIV